MKTGLCLVLKLYNGLVRMIDFLSNLIEFFVSFILGFVFMSAAIMIPKMYKVRKQTKKED